MYKPEREFGVDVCEIHNYLTPATPKFAIRIPKENDILIPDKMQTRFRIAVGSILILINFSHPDISKAVIKLAKVNNM